MDGRMGGRADGRADGGGGGRWGFGCNRLGLEFYWGGKGGAEQLLAVLYCCWKWYDFASSAHCHSDYPL